MIREILDKLQLFGKDLLYATIELIQVIRKLNILDLLLMLLMSLNVSPNPLVEVSILAGLEDRLLGGPFNVAVVNDEGAVDEVPL